jgi:two-component sensor histidine kinase
MSESERIYKTPSEIEAFVINTLSNLSSVNWEEADKYSDEDVASFLDSAQDKIVPLEKSYNILTATNDASIVSVVDLIMLALADAYAARHTFSTVQSVRSTLN